MEHSDPKLEAWVLGALMDADGPLLRSRASELVSAIGLAPDDFTNQANRSVFQAITSLAERDRAADARSVATTSRGMPGISEAVISGLQSLQVANACDRATLTGYGEELRRMTRLRRLSAFLLDTQNILKRPRPDVVDLAAKVSTFSDGFCATTEADETGEKDLFELLEEWDASIAGIRTPYLATGVEILDEQIDGFVPNLNVIGGMPSVGKSALIGEIIMACLERGIRVGLFGLEDATKWLARRHLARRMGIPVGRVGYARLQKEELERLQESAGEIANLTKNLVVYRRAGIEADEMVQRCKHWVLNLGVRAIFIDHGGEVSHESKQRDRYDLAVANTYRVLRDLAVNYRVPVVVLAHFNRDTEKDLGGVPTMQSFAETEYIARMARVALGLWQKPGDERLRCTVLKRTEGARGVTVAIERDEAYALVKRKGGEVLDLRAERQQDQKHIKALRIGGATW